jgi:hypothetical protein
MSLADGLRMRALALVLAACSSSPLAIEDIPGVDTDLFAHERNDCRLSAFTRRYFAGARVEYCGGIAAFGEHSRPKPAEYAALRACAIHALAAREPFFVEIEGFGTDSLYGHAYLAVEEHGRLAYYAVDLDSMDGGLAISRCGWLAPSRFGTMHLECVDDEPVVECRFDWPLPFLPARAP